MMQKSLMALAIVVFSALGALQAIAQAPQTGQSSQILKSEEIDQLVAPIALYPDTLLSQVLIASTYPLEVVEAERWVTQNKNLKGDALKKAVDQKKWDDSIKALTATPDVLAMMSDKLDWTQKLGDAVLAQQTDVMDGIQRLRQKAQANDKLKTTKQQKVTTSGQGSKTYIAIEPTEPNTVYVPYYDPAVVYGAWDYPSYPPYSFPAPGYIAGAAIATGLAFGAGYAVGAWARGGNWWGGNVNWGNNNININNDIDINKRNNWVHNSDHRHGVRYNNNEVRQKFSKTDIGNRDQRMDFRGRDGQQVLNPDRGPDGRPSRDLRPETRPADRPGGDRAGKDARPGGDRPGKDARPGGDRPGKDARPGGDKRAGADKRPGGDRPQARPQGPQRGGGFDNVNRGGGHDRARGQASLGPRGGGGPRVAGGGGGGPRQVGGGGGGGGRHIGGGGGGPRGGGGRGGGGRGRR